MTPSRVLAIDPGDKRIGIAVSDPSGTIANPVAVIKHRSRKLDSHAITELAQELDARLIVVGMSTDGEGTPSPQGRKAIRFAEELRKVVSIPIEFWDESNSTQIARQARIEMGVAKRKRQGHMDELAATVILQDFLDSKKSP